MAFRVYSSGMCPAPVLYSWYTDGMKSIVWFIAVPVMVIVAVMLISLSSPGVAAMLCCLSGLIGLPLWLAAFAAWVLRQP